MPSWLENALGYGLAPVTGGVSLAWTDPGQAVLGEVTGSKQDAKAREQIRQGLEEFRNVRLPSLEEQAVQLENLRLMGMLAPEYEQVVNQGRSELGGVQFNEQTPTEYGRVNLDRLGDTAYGGIRVDPSLRQAQMQALGGLRDIYTQGGLTAMDRARLADIRRQEDEATRGQELALERSMRARGMAGSGLEAAAALQNVQSGANRASARDLDVAALAQQRALDALMQSGQLGGQIRGQEFGEQEAMARARDAIAQYNTEAANQLAMQRAGSQDVVNRYNTEGLLNLRMNQANAQDAINRYNAQNQQGVMGRNVGAYNQAQQYNLDAAQRVADQNVGLRNQQQMYNRALPTQQYNAALQRAAGLSGQYQNMAGAYAQQGQANRDMWGQLLGGGVKLATGL